MFRRRRQQVFAADDVGDSVVDVVDRRREVIGRGAVGPEDDEVVHLIVFERDLSANDVFERRPAGPRNLESNGRTLPCRDPLLRCLLIEVESAVVGRGRARGPCLVAERIELFRCRKRVVGRAVFDELVGDLLVALEASRLAVSAVGSADFDSLIPVEAEPAHRVQDVGCVLRRAALFVGVVGPQDHRAALRPHEEPVVERGAGTTDVQVAGRRRGEPNPGGHAWTTGFMSTPTPSISTSTRSPGTIGPTPEGVPVRMMSPGSRVMIDEMNETSSPTPNTRSAVEPDCRVSPLTREITDKPLLWIEVGVDGRAERAERVEALGSCPLTVGTLQVSSRDVVRCGVSENVRTHVLDGHVPRHAPDDDGKFCLVVHLFGLLRNANRLKRPDHRRRRLHEQNRRVGDVTAHLGSVFGVVLADGDDLGRDDRRQQASVFPVDHRLRWFPRDEGRAAIDADAFRLDRAVGDVVDVGVDPDDLHVLPRFRVR